MDVITSSPWREWSLGQRVLTKETWTCLSHLNTTVVMDAAIQAAAFGSVSSIESLLDCCIENDVLALKLIKENISLNAIFRKGFNQSRTEVEKRFFKNSNLAVIVALLLKSDIDAEGNFIGVEHANTHRITEHESLDPRLKSCWDKVIGLHKRHDQLWNLQTKIISHCYFPGAVSDIVDAGLLFNYIFKKIYTSEYSWNTSPFYLAVEYGNWGAIVEILNLSSKFKALEIFKSDALEIIFEYFDVNADKRDSCSALESLLNRQNRYDYEAQAVALPIISKSMTVTDAMLCMCVGMSRLMHEMLQPGFEQGSADTGKALGALVSMAEPWATDELILGLKAAAKHPHACHWLEYALRLNESVVLNGLSRVLEQALSVGEDAFEWHESTPLSIPHAGLILLLDRVEDKGKLVDSISILNKSGVNPFAFTAFFRTNNLLKRFDVVSSQSYSAGTEYTTLLHCAARNARLSKLPHLQMAVMINLCEIGADENLLDSKGKQAHHYLSSAKTHWSSAISSLRNGQYAREIADEMRGVFAEKFKGTQQCLL